MEVKKRKEHKRQKHDDGVESAGMETVVVEGP